MTEHSNYEIFWSKTFHTAKSFKKTDLKFVAEEIGESIPQGYMIWTLKEIILSKENKQDAGFL